MSTWPGSGTLGIDPDDLARCVSCGLCLAHCPTFRATGEEALSPRGRISAMRAVEEGEPADETFLEMVGSCVMCRACETACPSSVPFGRLMEATRHAVARRAVPGWQRLAYRVLEHPRLLSAITAAGGIAQRARLVPRRVADRLAVPALPVRRAPLRPGGPPGGDAVWLFTGCVMDAWQRPVHQAAIDVLAATGARVHLPGRGASCCGALHLHAGLHDRAVLLARRVMAALPGPAPVLVDSAGCGAALKEYGSLLGTLEARRFSERVLDVHEWLAARAERLPEPAPGVSRRVIAVQDPCHLRHVQHGEGHVRTVLRRYGELVELADDGRCCGAGGAYSVLHPALAGLIRDQKVAVIAAAGADVVASANPGCSMWLSGAGVAVRHPVEIVAAAAGLSGPSGAPTAGDPG